MTQDGMKRYTQDDKKVTEGEKKNCIRAGARIMLENLSARPPPSLNPPHTR